MPEDREPAARFLRAYSRFVCTLWEASRDYHRRYDLSGPQMGILRLLERMGPSSLSDLRRFTGGYLSSLAQMVDRLAEAGWLVRERDPRDRRRLKLQLTPKARRMLRKEPLLGPPRALAEMERMAPAEAEAVARAMELVARVMVGEDSGAGGKRRG